VNGRRGAGTRWRELMSVTSPAAAATSARRGDPTPSRRLGIGSRDDLLAIALEPQEQERTYKTTIARWIGRRRRRNRRRRAFDGAIRL